MTKDYPKFNLYDFACWKFLPSKWGCGKNHLWSFKYSWIRHNKQHIKNASADNDIPPFLLAGVALTEVGGKDFTDWPAFLVRSFDWSGPDWVDSHLTITKNPLETSMGAVSIQLRRAAETMGIDPYSLKDEQLLYLAGALQSDKFNLQIVAKHLRQLLFVDYPMLLKAEELTDEQVKMVGTRYWYGPEKNHAALRIEALKESSYGSRILQHKQLLLELLQ